VQTDYYAGPVGDTEADMEAVASPFAGLSYLDAAEHLDETEPAQPGESPFEGFYATTSPFNENEIEEAEPGVAEAADFLETIHDEDFDEALEQLLDEGAAHLLADARQWASPQSAAEAREVVEQWIAPLASQWEHAIDGLGAGLESADFTEMAEQELDQFLDSLDSPASLGSEAFENFFGSLLKKAKGFIKSKIQQAVKFVKNPIKGVLDVAASGLNTIKSGVKAIGSQLLGPLLNKLKSVGLALLKGVIAKLVKPLTNLLPAQVRPLVPILTKRLGIGEVGDAGEDEHDQEVSDGAAAELAHAFDNRLLALYLSSDSEDATSDETNDELYDEQQPDAIAELDDARARLANQLSEYTGSAPPVAEIEQFIPVVLAIRPLLKLGLKLTGARDKLINLIAEPLAALIKKMIGADAANTIAQVVGQEPSRMIARAAVGVGFTALGLEAPATAQDGAMSGEALASAVESTVMRVADELDESSATDPLQVSAMVQRAFAESAAAYLPDRLLRSDLPERETAEEGGFWVMMPRAVRPRYRFRRYTRVIAIPITRQMARAVPWSDGGTLETYLRDRGVHQWPLHAEVDLYESMPGTMLGHLTQDETLPGSEKPAADEFQPLTRRTAGILLGEPALGRPHHRVGIRAGAHHPRPGQRYFRVRVGQLPARRGHHPRRRVSVHLHPAARRLRISIRLSESCARALQVRLQRTATSGQRDLPGVLTALREIYLPHLKLRITHRLLKSSLVTDPVAAAQLAQSLVAATNAGISAFLTHKGAQLAAAVADPAEGVTIRITFNGIGSTASQVSAPVVTVIPGAVR
jgi:hypothetical protein